MFEELLRQVREFSAAEDFGMGAQHRVQEGVSFTTVNRWENGHTRPSTLACRSLEKLAAQHGAPLTLTQDSAVAAVDASSPDPSE